MSRFVLGEDYIFVRTLFEKGKARFGIKYFPWEDKLQAIEIVKLTCMSEHDVAWDQDPEGDKKNKGYIFKDELGNPWYNQYPTAVYGQLDDSSDRIVRQHFEETALLEYNEAGEALKDSNGRYIRVKGSEKLWDTYDSQFWNPFESAEAELSSMYRAIHPIREAEYNLTDNEKAELEEHMQNVVKLVEEKSGKKVEFKPIVLKFLDGRPDELSKLFKAYLV